MKKVEVDYALCQKHGQCVISAPDIFSFDDNGELQYRNSVEDSELDDALDAMDSCPAQAILVEE